MIFFIHFIFSFIATMAFGIIANVPRRMLLPCGFTGATGWVLYYFTLQLGIGLGAANFLGALSIGILSVFFSRIFKMPLIIFNIPGLVPLVPGGAAYQAVRQIMQGNYEAGMQNILVVIVTAGAIAIGFMVTNLIEKLVKQIWHTSYPIRKRNVKK